MRNMVSVIDPKAKKPIFNDLAEGQMFRYIDASNEDNIYMKVFRNGGFAPDGMAMHGAVLLNTGVVYFNVKGDRPVIEVVSEINIKR